MLKKLTPFLIFIATLSSSYAQEQQVDDWMIAQGFENVQSLMRGDTLFLTYENRVYRYEVAALKAIIANLTLNANIQTLVIYPKYQNLPTVQLIIPTVEKEFYSKITFKTDLWASTGFGTTASANQTAFKADLSIGPWIYATQIGNYDDAIKIELDLAPTLHVQLTKGLKFTGQLLVPVINNYSDDGIRPGIVTLEQSIRLPWNTFATASIGQYIPRRYGTRLNVMKYDKSGVFGIGGTLGYTRLSSISGEEVNMQYADRATHIARINGRIRWPKQDFMIDVSFGTFLYQDLGLKIEARRQFGESQVSIFAMSTSLIDNAGFAILVPIPTKKYHPIKNIRLRTHRFLHYEYRFRRQREAAVGGMEMLQYYDINLKLTELQPAFLYNKLFEHDN